MANTLYTDPGIGVHRYQLCIDVDEAGTVQASAKACCILDNSGNPVLAKDGGVDFTVPAADVTALQALVDTELSGKTQSGTGRIELWIKDGALEKGANEGPWFHYQESVAANGLIPASTPSRNPALAVADANMDSLGSAAVAAVNTAIA